MRTVRQARAPKQKQFRLIFVALPAASLLIAVVFDLVFIEAGDGPVPTLSFYALALSSIVIWTAVAWWPTWKRLNRHNVPGIIRVPCMAAVGALLGVPFAVVTLMFHNTVLFAFFAATFGVSVGILGALAMVIIEEFTHPNRFRESRQDSA